MKDKDYQISLDILRIFFCISILLYHLNILNGGFLAVSSFLVLSGYLSVKSAFNKDKFNIFKYYINRIIKIYLPLLIVVFLTIPFVLELDDVIWLNIKPEVHSLILPYNNYWQLKVNLDYFARHIDSPFMHLWYIALLLQLELIFPILFIILRKIGKKFKNAPIIISIILSIISFIFFCKSINSNFMLSYYGTIERSFSWFLGIALAFYEVYHKDNKHGNKLLFFINIIISILLFIFIKSSFKYLTIIMLFISIITILLINSSKSFNGNNKLIKYLANISYEVYLVQYPVIYIVGFFNINKYVMYLLVVICTLIISMIIHYVLSKNKKMMLFKVLFSIGIFGLSFYGLYRFIKEKDYSKEILELEAELQENESALTKYQEEYEKEREKEDNEIQAVFSDEASTEEMLNEIVSNLKVTGVGDSVMLGAVPQLLDAFPGSYFDAKISRTAWVVNDILVDIKNQGNLGDVVVLNLGANGDCSTSCKDEIMATIGDREVFWFNVTNDAKVHVNDKLNAYAENYANLHIIDWASISKDHSDYFAADGIHLTSTGKPAYVNALKEAINNVYKEKLENNKETFIKQRQDEINSKRTLMIGNDLLLNLYPYLSTIENKNINYNINKYNNYDELKKELITLKESNTLEKNIYFVYDNSFNLTYDNYNELSDLLTDYNLNIIALNSDLLTITKDNVNIIEFTNIDTYLSSDRIHLNEEGNKELSSLIETKMS